MTFILAALVGISLGLLGSGGSVLAVPILKFSAGFSARAAIATSLATVGSVSLVGCLLAWKEGRVLWKSGFLFSLFAILGTFGGVELATRISEKLQMGLFVGVMGYAAFLMFRAEADPAEVAPPKRRPWLDGLKAVGVGVLTGLVGVGGGFLIVPALVSLFDIPMRKATGTSLLVIAINSAVGTLSYSQAIELDWGFTAGFSGSAVVGLLVGMRLAKRISEEKLRRLFAVLLAVVCVYTAVQEFH